MRKVLITLPLVSLLLLAALGAAIAFGGCRASPHR